MKNIYIQKGYKGKEVTGCVNYCNSIKNEDYKLVYIDCVSQITSKPECIIGSVEFIEQYIENKSAIFYPIWARCFLRRDVFSLKLGLSIKDILNLKYRLFPNKNIKRVFVKHRSKYKKFEACHISCHKNSDKVLKEFLEKEQVSIDDCIFSEVVNFVDEWRYYVVNGEVVSSWWYQGIDETCMKNPNGPYLKMNIPKDFCGAIDMGMLDSGEFALVEVQHPYAIGWYGEQDDFDNYLKFLIEGFKTL